MKKIMESEVVCHLGQRHRARNQRLKGCNFVNQGWNGISQSWLRGMRHSLTHDNSRGRCLCLGSRGEEVGVVFRCGLFVRHVKHSALLLFLCSFFAVCCLLSFFAEKNSVGGLFQQRCSHSPPTHSLTKGGHRCARHKLPERRCTMILFCFFQNAHEVLLQKCHHVFLQPVLSIGCVTKVRCNIFSAEKYNAPLS